MARPAALLACVLLMALAGGCWDRQEIEKSAIAVAIGIDRADPPDRYKVTLQFGVPTRVGDGGQAGREPVATNWVVSSTEVPSSTPCATSPTKCPVRCACSTPACS